MNSHIKICRTIWIVVICFEISLLNLNKPVYPQSTSPDSLALVAIYYALDGPNWKMNTNWLTDKPVKEWYGVSANESGVVDQIDLTENNLIGRLPAEIGELSNLSHLFLNKNNISGTIPGEIYNLVNLELLWLRQNRLTGEILPQIGNLRRLHSFQISENQLSGTLPEEFWRLISLKTIALGQNQFTGSLPSEIGNLINLEYLWIGFCKFSGQIPSVIGNLLKMKEIAIQCNQFSGQLPPEIGNLTELEELILFDNDFTGPFPEEITNLTKLENLRININQFTSLPDLSGLEKLDSLSVWSNKLQFGDIEPNVGKFPEFIYSPQAEVGFQQEIYISLDSDTSLSVSVTGTANKYQWYKDGEAIPGAKKKEFSIDSAQATTAGTYYVEITNSIADELTLISRPIIVYINEIEIQNIREILAALYSSLNGSNWKRNTNWLTDEPYRNWYGVTADELGRITALRLNENNLTGYLPPEIGDLDRLEYLELFNNSIGGQIPDEIGKLIYLKKIELQDNQLIGEIPSVIGDLTSLENLLLWNNQLSGPIPAEIGNLQKLLRLNANRNQITGEIPSSIGDLTNLIELNFSRNRLTGNIPEEIEGMSGLKNLSLSVNLLDGELPATLGSLTNLRFLSLVDNNIEGTIPEESKNLSNIKYIAVSNNLLSGNIPVELFTLDSLKYLYLNGNQFSGSIPPEIGNLENLEYLHLFNNRLSGNIPEELGKLTKLKRIWIQGNEFDGLPDITAFQQNADVRIYNNRFTFEDIVPNAGYFNRFLYSPQAQIGEEQEIIIKAGNDTTFSVDIPEYFNTYRWYKDGYPVQLEYPVIPGNLNQFLIRNAAIDDIGVYRLEVTNNNAKDLRLVSKPVTVQVKTKETGPEIFKVSRNTGGNTGFVTLKIEGSGFQPDASVRLTRDGYEDIVADTLWLWTTNSTEITAVFDLTDKEHGLYDIEVANQDNSSCVLSNAFTIEEGISNTWLDIIGRDQIRIGRDAEFIIVYENSGNIDLDERIMFLTIDSLIEYSFDSTLTQDQNTNSGFTKGIIKDDENIIIPIFLPRLVAGGRTESKLIVKYTSTPFSKTKGKELYKNRLSQQNKKKIRVSIIDRLKSRRFTDAFEEGVIQSTELQQFYEEYNVGIEEQKEIKKGIQKIGKGALYSYLYTPLFIGILTLLLIFIAGIPPPIASNFASLIVQTVLASSTIVLLAKELDKAGDYVHYKYYEPVQSLDPNEKAGPAGFGDSGFIQPEIECNYTTYFENVDSATAAAQEIRIIDTLDSNLDISTFQFGSFQIADTVIDLSINGLSFHRNVILNDSVAVDVSGNVDPSSRIVEWYLRGNDIKTGDYGDILFPNINPPEGDGNVKYLIKPESGLSTGTRLQSSSEIIFDVNPPLKTNIVLNTIDALPPASSVNYLNPEQAVSGFPVNWSGNDDVNGSGMRNYSVYVSDNGGPYEVWMTTEATSAVFTGENGHSYSFYSVACDNVGHYEVKEPVSEAVTTIKLPAAIAVSPSPFVPSRGHSKITFFGETVPYSKIKIYNKAGNLVRILEETAGSDMLEWNGTGKNGNNLPSGVYIFVAKTSIGKTEKGKFAIIR